MSLEFLNGFPCTITSHEAHILLCNLLAVHIVKRYIPYLSVLFGVLNKILDLQFCLKVDFSYEKYSQYYVAWT